MTLNQVQHIINEGEGETLEFKSSFNKAVIETIIAMSNKKGGKIILGIKNDKKIIGVTVTEETIQKWINEIKQNTQPSVFPDFELIYVENKNIIIISIDEFPLKPVTYKDRAYIRLKNSNHKLNIDEITEMRNLSLNYSFDSFKVDTSYNELDTKALEVFQNRMEISGRFKPSKSIKDDLIKLDLIKKEGKLTRAAELLFGNHKTNIHIGRFKSQTTIIDDLMIRSPLIIAVEEAIDFIKKNIRLAFDIGGETLKRNERWQFPIPALRELLLNAIVHRDYTKPTDVIIKIYDESIEITNPGKLMGGLTIEDLKTDYYISKHRNKLITEAFYLTGDIEKYGTGFKRVREWFLSYPNLDFEVLDYTDSIQVKVFNLKKVGDKVGDKVGEGLSKNQILIIENIKQNNKISARELSGIIGISSRKIEENIKKLKDKAILKRIGAAKGGYWQIITT